MLDTIMLVIYLCTIAYLAYLLTVMFIRKSPLMFEKSLIHSLAFYTRLRASRILFMLKVLRTILLKPIVLLPIIALIIFMLISARAAIPAYSWYKVSGEPFNETVVTISFINPISIGEGTDFAETLIEEITKSINVQVRTVMPIARLSLAKPIILNNINRSIYVIVALPDNYIAKLKESLELGMHVPYILSCDKTLRSNCIPPHKLLNLVVIDDVYLLPVQGYIGLKPIFPPPGNVMITSLNYLPKVLGEDLGDEVITDLVIVYDEVIVTDLSKLMKLLLVILSKYGNINKAELVCPLGKFLYSRVAIPTSKSLIVATTTSIISIIVLLAVLHSMTPEIKSLYGKLLLVGMPQWSMTIISSLYVSILILLVGVPTLIYIYLRYGGLPTFNSFLTLSITWLSSLTYMNSSLKPKSLTKSDVYIPITRRYDLMLSNGIDLSRLENVIKDSLKTNEFFTIEELESQRYPNEVVIHARLMYNEVWGSGLDLNIVLSRDEESVKVHISSYVWGIEEISESIMNTMLGLAISRIVGAIRSCLT